MPSKLLSRGVRCRHCSVTVLLLVFMPWMAPDLAQAAEVRLNAKPAKPAWKWTLDERLAKRFDPAEINPVCPPLENYSDSKFKQSRQGINVDESVGGDLVAHPGVIRNSEYCTVCKHKTKRQECHCQHADCGGETEVPPETQALFMASEVLAAA